MRQFSSATIFLLFALALLLPLLNCLFSISIYFFLPFLFSLLNCHNFVVVVCFVAVCSSPSPFHSRLSDAWTHTGGHTAGQNSFNYHIIYYELYGQHVHCNFTLSTLRWCVCASSVCNCFVMITWFDVPFISFFLFHFLFCSSPTAATRYPMWHLCLLNGAIRRWFSPFFCRLTWLLI